MDFDARTDLDMITDEELKRNVKIHDAGYEDMDVICDECQLSRMVHPNLGWEIMTRKGHD